MGEWGSLSAPPKKNSHEIPPFPSRRVLRRGERKRGRGANAPREPRVRGFPSAVINTPFPMKRVLFPSAAPRQNWNSKFLPGPIRHGLRGYLTPSRDIPGLRASGSSPDFLGVLEYWLGMLERRNVTVFVLCLYYKAMDQRYHAWPKST